MPLFHSIMVVESGPLRVTISVSQNDVNLKSWLIANSPWPGTYREDFEVTVSPGVVLGSTSASTAGLIITGFPSGSRITLINKGRIQGKGGQGGQGGVSSSSPGVGAGQPGSVGGPAISLGQNITINNGSGEIWGGGGGGGGGGEHTNLFDGGSGGGGGAGTQGGDGGGGGTGQFNNGSSGASGTPTAGGAGGTTGFNGGPGGAPGAAGTSGATGAGAGGAGGAAGKAVELGGFIVTWLSGSGSPQVKGDVS